VACCLQNIIKLRLSWQNLDCFPTRNEKNTQAKLKKAECFQQLGVENGEQMNAFSTQWLLAVIRDQAFFDLIFTVWEMSRCCSLKGMEKAKKILEERRSALVDGVAVVSDSYSDVQGPHLPLQLLQQLVLCQDADSIKDASAALTKLADGEVTIVQVRDELKTKRYFRVLMTQILYQVQFTAYLSLYAWAKKTLSCLQAHVCYLSCLLTWLCIGFLAVQGEGADCEDDLRGAAVEISRAVHEGDSRPVGVQAAVEAVYHKQQ
jgi:hypothetical protein